MGLSPASIQAAKDDDGKLFDLLSAALNELFPPHIQKDPDQFLTALAAAPRGLRAIDERIYQVIISK